ncbi:MAG: DUF4058 family protein [Nostocaceae cyanobacterium]|nr:DUF4058 family protein [Nostocaceae cyanobacterium]
MVDLQSLLAQIYDQARFDMAIDYTQAPIPPLKKQDEVWADIMLRELGRR